MSTSHYEQERELHDDIEAALQQEMPAVDVLEVEFDAPHQVVRAFINMEGGVTHKLCVDVTNAVRETCPRYALEVSSPGIEPPLRKQSHFAANVGARVKLRRQGGKRPFTAYVERVSDDAIEVRRESGTNETIPFHEIVRCHRLQTAAEAAHDSVEPTTARSAQ